MKNVVVKVDGDTLDAIEFNPSTQECMNAVTDTGQTLNASDNHQVSKAMSVYATSGDYLHDGGTGNNYALSAAGSAQLPIAYRNGLRVRFFAQNANTGASTITISGLPTVPLKKGPSSSPIDLVSGDVLQGIQYMTTAIYYDGPACFILDPSNYTQIISIATRIQLPPGFVTSMIYTAANTPTGWVVMNDGTIGSATSGGTTRANADCQNLFYSLWNNVANTYAPVSSGRGASAAADWTANKTIKLLTTTGKVIANAGASAIGLTAGNSTLTLGIANMPSHGHLIHTTNTDVSGAGHIPTGSSATLESPYPSTESSGSGSSIDMRQPTLYLNYFIKL
jgi:hypothetical protein